MTGISAKFNVKDREIKEKLKRVLFKSMLDMQTIAKQKAPVDTGRLRNSIKLFPSIFGSRKYLLVATVNYAEGVEFGTSPHFVSAEVLRDWARRVLGDESAAGAVSDKIRKFGTEAQPFMRPALFQVKKTEVKKNFDNVLKF